VETNAEIAAHQHKKAEDAWLEKKREERGDLEKGQTSGDGADPMTLNHDTRAWS
jgi:hypothetical protein